MSENNNDIREETALRARRRRRALREQSAAQTTRPPRNDIKPHLKIVNWPIEKLKAPTRQVRRLAPEQVERVKTSIQTFGFVVPLLVRTDGEIIKGHIVAEAARQLGFTDVPCIPIEHLGDVEVRTMRIALNKLAESGKWDFEALKLELQDLVVLDAPLDATGFTLPELDGLMLVNEPTAGIDEAPALEESQPAVTQPGQIWRLNKHLIACGDARDPAVSSLMPERSAGALAAITGAFSARLVAASSPPKASL